MNTLIYLFAVHLIIVLSVLNGRCTAVPYVIPAGTGYHAPTAAGYDYAWQLYSDVFNGTYPYNKYMGPWVLMTDFIDVYMQADILAIETIVSPVYYCCHYFFPVQMPLGATGSRVGLGKGRVTVCEEERE
jgi:hypothetical protein